MSVVPRVLAASALIAGLLVLAPPAGAATISPTVLTDDNTVNGNCTLREAVRSANENVAVDACTKGDAGMDTIVLGAGTYMLTVPSMGGGAAEDGDLDVIQSLNITGMGTGTTAIEAGTATPIRVLDIGNSGTEVAISDLTLRNGSGDFGGNVYNLGDVFLTRTIVEGGKATAGHGGGIFTTSGATTTLTDSLLRMNESTAGGGSLAVDGGTLNVHSSTITGNTSSTAGGGVLGSAGSSLTLTRSTISGNKTDGYGGGIFTDAGTVVTLNGVTVSGNTADADAAGGGDGGGMANDTGTETISNTIVADNTDATPAQSPAHHDCYGNDLSGGHNLVETTSVNCVATGPGNVTGMDPVLGPLGDHGGPTPTMPLLTGSPAIGAGDPARVAALAACTGTDQRGASRSDCDIGAYELTLCREAVVNRIGTEGNDTLTGTDGDDGFLAGGGNDRVTAVGGNDTACLGAGNDRASGGGGRDVLLGEAGKDSLKGQGGKDLLICGPGKNEKGNGGPGKDKAKGCEKGKA